MIQVSHIDFQELNQLLKDDDVTDIMYHKGEVWVDDLKKGHIKTELSIKEIEVERIAHHLAKEMKTNFNATNPVLDAETKELRVNCIHKSLSPNGLVMAIRKTPINLRLNDEYLIETNYLTFPALELLKRCIKSRLNIVIAGETGAGKTELLKYLVQYIKDHERIITIEDTLETRLNDIYKEKDIVSLKINHQFKYSELIRTSLRQRPDWILVSETRGSEISDLIDSIASGHSIITTIHAMSAKDIPKRMVMMKKSSDPLMDEALIYHYFDIGIYIRKVQNNGIERQIVEIVEYINEDKNLRTRTLYEVNDDEFVLDCLSDVTVKKMNHKTAGCYL